MKKTFLVNLGGIKSLADIPVFLFNMFNDKNIIPAKQPLRVAVSAVITACRMFGTYSIYKSKKSPIFQVTQKQKEKLKNRTNKEIEFKFSYSTPKIKKDSLNFYIPMYGFYSHTTHGKILENVKNVSAPFCIFGKFFDLIENSIKDKLTLIPNNTKTAVILSAHSLPESLAQKTKDSYRNDLEVFKKYLQKRFEKEVFLSFQSKLGPVKWFEPSTAETIKGLAKKNYEALVVVPISFVTDNTETVYEIDIEYAELAKDLQFKYFLRTECFNDSDEFIEFLAGIL